MKPDKYLLAALAFSIVPAVAAAHVTVAPKVSIPGSFEKYDLRMPNERQVDTTVLEVRFPAGLRVVSFRETPGWTIKTIYDSAGAITGARWTGQLPPERFVEFGVMAQNPKGQADLVWVASQTYEDGTVVNWSGPDGSRTPAPKVSLKPAEH